MKYTVKVTSKFKKDYKLIKRRGYDLQRLRYIVNELANGNTLPPMFRDHQLTGNHAGKRECHIYPDWLLIYRIIGNELILELCRTGTHSDVFDK